MVRVVISIYDTVAGEYKLPATSINENTAIRDFQIYLESMPKAVVNDEELYLIGSFDTKTGVLTSCEHKLLMRGSDKIGSV